MALAALSGAAFSFALFHACCLSVKDEVSHDAPMMAVPASLRLFVAFSLALPAVYAAGCSSPSNPPFDAGTDAQLDIYQTPDRGPIEEVVFPALNSLSSASGKNSFRFGVATAATQIEDQNEDTDWWAWTAPVSEGGLAKTEFVGDAVRGYTNAQADLELLSNLSLDAYRFSMEWARIEPSRNQINEGALTHYRALLDGLKTRNIRPMVTVHHFSNPTWIDDPRKMPSECVAPYPNDSWLCGFANEAGFEEILKDADEHACLLGTRFGDLVDEWATVNEPVNYALASYGAAQFPPGRNYLFQEPEIFVNVLRNILRLHVAIYDALKRCDTVDADGDGSATSIGLPLSVIDWVPARNNLPSSEQADIDAANRVRYVYHQLFVDSLLQGGFDANIDGVFEESHPNFLGKLEWLGVQYYFRAGVTAAVRAFPIVDATICFGPLDLGSCLPPAHPSFLVPTMHYEYWSAGLGSLLREFGARWPALPMVVTEGGIATNNGQRRAENIVRSLEEIAAARGSGADVRGYYHWTLMDNFEWSEGFAPHFGLYSVERTGSYPRTINQGGEIYRQLAQTRTLSIAQQMLHGGLGPMSPELP